MKILSPAKLNLMLRILGQRPDGYHLLQTYFQLLNWGDDMNFILLPEDKIIVEGDFGDLKTEDNLIYKAALLLLPHRQLKQGIKITVEKNIPQGSGLGGGSSNAGTTLRELNTLWNCQLSQNKLQKLALTLGADVPVFVMNQSAMATGIGEKLTPYNIENYYFVLIFPITGINTIDVFSKKDLNRKQKTIELMQINDMSNWTNSCLTVVLDNFPEVKSIYNEASKISSIYMSGSGSTLFACFNNFKKAEEFIQQCPSHWDTQICQSQIN
jgi:4-diphosphocytidyl-2-C-methyl-D-erythritol kinase